MGQYFIVANTTRQEFLHPHKFGEGLKFLEFTTGDFGVMHGLAHLLAQSSDGVAIDDPESTGRWIGDNVVIVGDYDDSGIFRDAVDSENYTDISNAVIQHIGRDNYVQQELCERNRWGVDITDEGIIRHPVFQNGGSFMMPELDSDGKTFVEREREEGESWLQK